jgi:hypothetical protein
MFDLQFIPHGLWMGIEGRCDAGEVWTGGGTCQEEGGG